MGSAGPLARRRCCAACAIATGAFLLLLGCWSIHLFFRFTPVYQEIRCKPGNTALKNVTVGIPGSSPSSFNLHIEVKCSNPNPYSVRITYSKEGGVFIGSSRTRVGSAMEVPFSDSFLPANGNGSVWTEAFVELTGPMLAKVVPIMLLGRGVPLYIVLDQKLEIDIFFFFGHWRMSRALKKNCGLRIASVIDLIGNKDAKSGPMACADSFDDLVVPPLQAQAEDGSLSFSAMKIAPKEVEQGQLAKNIGLGTTIGVSFTLGLALLAGGLLALRQSAKEAGGDGQKDVESTDESVGDSSDAGDASSSE